ncbi:hypothetical protein [Mycobacterium sp.]|uniref:hypothetical protein n=1 Tax=Mycobacterium sp. TaxID=1785 RepID=UPI002C8817E9|nr:hypothetical protein [Mycobacterium sp.]HTY35427.1 hypothetical protein [Mycobacterium sp.]
MTQNTGGWYGLAGIVADQRLQRRSEASRRPAACFDDGEPLRPGPDGELYCRFCGRHYEGKSQLDYDKV